MKNDDAELMRGSGNVYRDFGRPDAGLEQARAIIAGKIIDIINDRKLTMKRAPKQLIRFCSIGACAHFPSPIHLAVLLVWSGCGNSLDILAASPTL